MKAYLIDPRLRSVAELEYDGTLEGLMQLYPYSVDFCDMSRFTTDNADTLIHLPIGLMHIPLLGDVMLKEDGAWGYMCGNCDKIHTIPGKALIAGRRVISEGHCETQEPGWSIQQVRNWVKWASIVEFTPQEAMNFAEDGTIPDRLKPEDEFLPADAIVKAAMELASISTKH